MSERVYTLFKGNGADRIIIQWGVSRFGNKHDQEMEDAVSVGQILGKEHVGIEWLPEPCKQRSPEMMRAQRLRNMRKRLSKYPLFFDEFEKAELRKEYFSLKGCQADYEDRTKTDQEWMAKWWKAHPDILRVRLPNPGQSAETVADNVQADVERKI